MAQSLMSCTGLSRAFPAPGGSIQALDEVSLRVERGEFVVIKGPSGCGKSTLLLTLGGMQRPTRGSVVFGDAELYGLPATERNRWRAREVGFVFQLFHLIPYLSVRDNVAAGLAESPSKTPRSIDDLLDSLKLSDRARSLPNMLSAGERQRAALARALVKNPSLILADEPTGNLDPTNAAIVFEKLSAFRETGGTVVVVTHGHDTTPHASRTLEMEQGRIVRQSTR